MHERETRVDDIYLVAHGITPDDLDTPGGEFAQAGAPSAVHSVTDPATSPTGDPGWIRTSDFQLRRLAL